MGGAAGAHRSGITRFAALASVIAVSVLVALLLFGSGGDSYALSARFINAGQLVKGNLVELGGVQIGQVTDFEITDDGEAEVEFEVEDDYAPLPAGSRLLIRPGSLSSVANRFIEVHLPSASERDAAAGEQEMLADGAVIESDRTTSVVEIDTFFSMFDKKTRESIQGFFRGGRRQYAGVGDDANRGLPYLKTNLSAAGRLFRELTYDPPVLERFIQDSSRLVTALAEKEGELSPLVNHLNRTTRALGSEKEALAELVSRLPDFMRTANTTYVNLRGALDDVDPLVEESKPVARKLQPFLAELRPFARDARPAVADLSAILRREGASNDLIDLTGTLDPLARVAVDGGERNGKRRPGAFEEIAKASRDAKPIIAFGRPYTPELFGWFDDFSTPGTYDALGGLLRFQVVVNAFSVQAEPGRVLPVPLPNRAENFKQLMDLGEVRRCPGGGEAPAPDGSNVPSAELQRELGCRDADRAVDP
jgi:phospholipid/cholesterol/gamma-HCH transport system substrate-binding protein